MTKSLIPIGVIVAIFGTIFFFQGIGVIGGSAMTDTKQWTILGPIIAIVGLVLVYLGTRAKPKA